MMEGGGNPSTSFAGAALSYRVCQGGARRGIPRDSTGAALSYRVCQGGARRGIPRDSTGGASSQIWLSLLALQMNIQ